MKTNDFDYLLPPDLIAQTPPLNRRDSRLLVVEQAVFKDQQFRDFLHCCQPGDLLVMNNTRVVPARLICFKPSGGRVEVMLERLESAQQFLALARSNKPLKPGQLLYIEGEEKLEYVGREGTFFRFKFCKAADDVAYDLFHQYGSTPLPPYIKRQPGEIDKQRYQTVYAKRQGAVAAPTAGLHFDDNLLADLGDKGVECAEITLHVGAGTFQPVKVDELDQVIMHHEWFDVSAPVVEKITQTKAAGGRVIAIGTTTARALESAAESGNLSAQSRSTNIFISPGYEFKVVDLLLTNFHLPKSTLLMMISAFGGFDNIKKAYAHAIEQQYRFFSYGDVMLLHPVKLQQ